MPGPQASRMDRVQPPATVAAGELARRLLRQGEDVMDLGQSSPHYTTPPHIVEAGVKALRDGLTNTGDTHVPGRYGREAGDAQRPRCGHG